MQIVHKTKLTKLVNKMNRQMETLNKKAPTITPESLGYDTSSDDYYEDLNDAIDHHDGRANRNMESYGEVSEAFHEKVVRPDQLLPKSELKGEPGWLKQFPSEQWADKLKEVFPKRDYSHTIAKKLAGDLSPAITINDELCDGYGRVHLAHALGEHVPVIQHKRKQVK